MPRHKKAGSISKPEPSELQIHIAVVQHLKYRARKGIVWWHTPSEGKRTKGEAAKQKALGFIAGIPDLIIIADGKTYGLELKTSRGRLSPEQKGMLAVLNAAGAFASVAYGLDQAISILQAWGLLAGGGKALAGHATAGATP
jgi:hypothetical protein